MGGPTGLPAHAWRGRHVMGWTDGHLMDTEDEDVDAVDAESGDHRRRRR